MSEEELAQRVWTELLEIVEPFKTGERLNESYSRLWELISSRTSGPEQTSVLEIGCSTGNFVKWLRNQGYDAIGIDIGENLVQTTESEHVVYGDMTSLEDAVGDKTFDFVVANAALNTHTLAAYCLMENGKTPDSFSMTPEIQHLVDATIYSILKGSFEHLKSGGFFIVTGKIYPKGGIYASDDLSFSRETAKNIGYDIKQYGGSDSILQKP